MITRIAFENFKGFEKFEIKFDRINLLVGGNNSGKTTVFHALQFLFWCIDQTVDVSDSAATFRKTQVPEVGALPYFTIRDIFFRQQLQSGRRPVRLVLSMETETTPPLKFEVYRAFSRNLMVDGSDQKMARAEYDRLANMKPVYIPGAVGITVQEEYLRAVSQQRLISEGRQNQVLRNLVYRLHQEQSAWDEFAQLMSPLFALQGMNVPFDVSTDEWLTATYIEEGCEFDLVSAGSGFLQTINLLCFLFLNESKTALLDEPDSHMHDDLQRVVFDTLDRLSKKRNLQLIIATHSPTMVDAAGLESVLLIDRGKPAPLVARDVDTLVPLLADQGLSLPPNKVLETLRVRRSVFVEGEEADYDGFIRALGERYSSGFAAQTRGLKVFETGGAQKKWPFDAIDCFQRLLDTQLKYVYVSDRDFLTDKEIVARSQRAKRDKRATHHLGRRHRESYLLEPAVISRVVIGRWQNRHDSAVPHELTEQAIRAFILDKARELEDKARTDMMVAHEADLKGDVAHRTAGTEALNEYFRTAYVEPLARDEVPYKLLDAKETLRALRREIASKHQVSFSDVDLCAEFQTAEIPSDVTKLLDQILAMFPSRTTPAKKAIKKKPSKKATKKKPSKKATKKKPSKKATKKKSSKKGSAEKATKKKSSKKTAKKATKKKGSATSHLKLNAKEQRVLNFLRSQQSPRHLREIALSCFPEAGDKSYSWSRNSVRRLIAAKWLRKVAAGTYEVTTKGRASRGR